MTEYEFTTLWNVKAPLDRVWETIKHSESWNDWWKGVLSVTELRKGDADGLGSIRRSKWKSALPYTLEFDSEIVRIEPMTLIEARAFGELDGIGIWKLTELCPTRTRVQYDWNVKTTKPWMSIAAPIARPIFRWNHDVIMRWGEEGIRRKLET